VSIEFIGVVLVVAAIIVAARIIAHGNAKGIQVSEERVGGTVAFYNEILRAWAAHAANERIEGMPMRIETTFNRDFDWLESAVIVIWEGFKEKRYEVVLRDHIQRRGGFFAIVGSVTFEEI
jgi:hypothetical protein